MQRATHGLAERGRTRGGEVGAEGGEAEIERERGRTQKYKEEAEVGEAGRGGAWAEGAGGGRTAEDADDENLVGRCPRLCSFDL